MGYKARWGASVRRPRALHTPRDPGMARRAGLRRPPGAAEDRFCPNGQRGFAPAPGRNFRPRAARRARQTLHTPLVTHRDGPMSNAPANRFFELLGLLAWGFSISKSIFDGRLASPQAAPGHRISSTCAAKMGLADGLRPTPSGEHSMWRRLSEASMPYVWIAIGPRAI